MKAALQTQLTFQESPFTFSYNDTFCLIGSCFAVNMYQRLIDNKFHAISNPFGTIFNPASLQKLITHAVNGTIDEQHFLKGSSFYFHYDFHSEIRAHSYASLKALIHQKQSELLNKIKNQAVVVISLGTAWVYKLKATDKVVANCHKVPQQHFSKTLLEPGEIIQSLDAIINALKQINPELRFIFTLSPVRHAKDTLQYNSVSKSVLRYSIYKMLKTMHHADYFPSYELMMDELRDYRFYDTDMLHPSPLAIEIIWNRFVTHYFEQKTITIMEQWQKVKKALQHKPIEPESKAYQQFIKKTLKELAALEPYFDVSEEKAQLNADLI